MRSPDSAGNAWSIDAESSVSFANSAGVDADPHARFWPACAHAVLPMTVEGGSTFAALTANTNVTGAAPAVTFARLIVHVDPATTPPQLHEGELSTASNRS